MKIMSRFTMRNLLRSKRRAVITIIGIAISVALMTSVAVITASMLNYTHELDIAERGDWHVSISNVTPDVARGLQQDKRIRDTFLGTFRGFAKITKEGSLGKDYLFMRDFSADAYEPMRVRLMEGRLPEAPGEVVISSLGLKGYGDLHLGDAFEVTLGDRIDASGNVVSHNLSYDLPFDQTGNVSEAPVFEPRETVTLTVVGVIYPTNDEQYFGAGYVVIGYLEPQAPVTDVYFHLNRLTRNYENDALEVAATYGVVGNAMSFNVADYWFLKNIDPQLLLIMLGIALIVLLLISVAAVSLIYNAFAISVSERVHQIGILASIGATPSQRKRGVYTEALWLGAIGIVLGIGLGIGLMQVSLELLIARFDATLLGTNGVKLTLTMPVVALVFVIVFALLTIFISARRPARLAEKISPIEAIRQTDSIRVRREHMKTPRLARSLFGFEADLALKSLKRNRRRYRTTVISLVIALVLFLSAAMVVLYLEGSINDMLATENYDIRIIYGSAVETAMRVQLDDTIAAIEGVDMLAKQSLLVADIDIDASLLTENAEYYRDWEGHAYVMGNLIALDDASFRTYATSIGATAEDYLDGSLHDAILVHQGHGVKEVDGRMKQIAGPQTKAKSGSTFTGYIQRLLFEPGEEDAEYKGMFSIQIGAVTTKRPLGARLNRLGELTFVFAESAWQDLVAVDDVTGTPQTFENLVDESMMYGHMTYVTTHDDQLVEASLQELVDHLDDVNYFNIVGQAREARNKATIFMVFLYGFIGLISLITITNIINTMSTNVSMRRREFAMLRSVGMSPRALTRMVRFESFFYGLKSLLWGLPIASAIALLINYLEQRSQGSPFVWPWQAYIVAVIMIFSIVLSTMAYATRRLKRENIVDALKNDIF